MRVYDPALPTPRPRGIYVPVKGVWFKYGSPGHKAARKQLKSERRAARNRQWRENAYAQFRGEYVFDPSLPWPDHVQRELHSRGKLNSDFWIKVFDRYLKDK